MSVKQIEIELQSITLSALRWHEGRNLKVIALHGWLDNAASFSLLAPLLPNADIVALDMAGHGKSGFRVGEGAYNIWQDLIEIKRVAEHLGWSEFSIIGHSRGAMIATLYAGTFPEHIQKLCLLDAITPITSEPALLPMQLRAALDGVLAASTKRSTYYPSYDIAAVARMSGPYPLSEQASRLLAERAVNEVPERGFYWRYDKRLLVNSELRLTEEQAKAFVDRFPCCARVILAEGGFVHANDRDWYDTHEHLNIVEIEGDHHLQLVDNKDSLGLLAQIINDYLFNT